MAANLPLKFKILEKYRFQADFAAKVGLDESKVSRVIHDRKTLTAAEKRKWASLLGVEQTTIFADAN